MSRPATAAELAVALAAVGLVNESLRLLNMAMLGETSSGPDDRFGLIGESVANHCVAAATALDDLRARLAGPEPSDG